MNRCTTPLLGALALFLVAASASLAPLPASAQSAEFKPAVRQFPAAARRGEMVVLAPPAINLDGKADRLSVGSRIRDTNNMLVMSGTLVNQKLVVNYTRESAGNVHEVWILNSEEAREKRPGSKSSWFSFGSSADTTPPVSAKTP
ncbi:MAG: hypothetical protein ABI845_07670 [Polaromonas sp.]